MADRDSQKRLIKTFVNAIYLYDDHFDIAFNYTDNGKVAVRMQEINDAASGEVFGCCAQSPTKRIRNLGCGSFSIASSSRKILNCGRGVGRFLEKNQNFFRCFQNALRKWLLIQPENGCLSLLSPCTRRTPCSNKREKPLQAKLDYVFSFTAQ